MTKKSDQPSRLMRTGEVARLFEVDASTVVRWADEGTIPSGPKTLGGQRRFVRTEIEALHARTEAGGVA